MLKCFRILSSNLWTLFRNIHRISSDITLMWKVLIMWRMWKMLEFTN